MTHLAAIGTYLPPWVSAGGRERGPDEDALTMAVAAGRAADPQASAQRVTFVTRDFPLLEGGNGAVLLAALSLPADTPVAEILGGGPAALEQVLVAGPGTLVIAADDNVFAVGAAAVLTADQGPTFLPVSRQTRSLPLSARTDRGDRRTYVDPRLQREVGVRATLARLGVTGRPAVAGVAGLKAAALGDLFDTETAVDDASVSASGALRVLAAVVEAGRPGLIAAVEQATVTLAALDGATGSVRMTRDEVTPRELPKSMVAEGVGIPISMPAYARAFEPKIRWEAAIFEPGPGIDGAPQFPPRARVDDNGRLADKYHREPLPRTGTVYTHTTVRIPVPDLNSPYSLAVVALDGSPVRVLMKVTGVPAGETSIGQTGSVVLRKIAVRGGIPDYGYAFWPGRSIEQEIHA